MFLLHPGQQQHINDFVDFNFLDPGFRRGDDVFSAACQAYFK